MNARYYDPANGRFITKDTYRGGVDNTDQWHLYVYCANNPINYVDPSGHFRVANWIFATIVDVIIPGWVPFGPVAKIVSKMNQVKKINKAGAAYLRGLKNDFMYYIKMMAEGLQPLTGAAKKFADRVIGEKKRDFFKRKVKEMVKGILNGKIEEMFWEKTSKNKKKQERFWARLSAFFSLGSLCASVIDFYQHGKSFKGHVYVGSRKCPC